MRYSVLAFAAIILFHPAITAADPVKLPPGVALEDNAIPSGAAKIVLIVGSNYFKPGEHEYIAAGAVLMHLLKQTPNVAPMLALDWPKKPETLKDAKAVVFFFDGAEKHQALAGDHAKEIQTLIDAKAGLTQFHQSVDYPKDFGERARSWSGAAFEKSVSLRAHWIAEFKDFPKHDIFNGVTSFKIDDGWLWKLRYVDGMKGVTPLLRTVNPKTNSTPANIDESIISWAYDRPTGGRTFNFTGGHLHASFSQEGYRRYLVNGILWSAGVEVPKEGAKVELDAKILDGVLAPKPAAKTK